MQKTNESTSASNWFDTSANYSAPLYAEALAFGHDAAGVGSWSW